MYNYDFNENKERIEQEIPNVEIQFNKAYYLTNIVITNKNFLVFYDMNRDNILKGQGLQVLPDMNAIISIPIKKLNYEVNEVNTIILYQDEPVTLYGLNLDQYI